MGRLQNGGFYCAGFKIRTQSIDPVIVRLSGRPDKSRRSAGAHLRKFTFAGTIPFRKGELMHKQPRVRAIAIAALVAVAVAASFAALGMRPDDIVIYYRDTLTSVGFTVWVSGLMIATLFPPIVAITFWFGSKRARYGWLLHFLLVPVTYAVVREATAIMLMAANEPDIDGLTGWATVPGAMLMLLCPVVYFAALGFKSLRRRRASANGS